MKEEIKEAIIKCVNAMAENYLEETQYDEEGHAFKWRWSDCVELAVNDFFTDIKGWLECYDIEDISDEELAEVEEYASNITWKTIKDFEFKKTN